MPLFLPYVAILHSWKSELRTNYPLSFPMYVKTNLTCLWAVKCIKWVNSVTIWLIPVWIGSKWVNASWLFCIVEESQFIIDWCGCSCKWGVIVCSLLIIYDRWLLERKKLCEYKNTACFYISYMQQKKHVSVVFLPATAAKRVEKM